MEVRIGVARTNKYANSECGDSVETVERPRGGISVILADGQGSGKPAKITSSLVVNKASSLIADGARDGAVARSVHDFLYAVKDGKVSSTLTILSADLESQTVVFCRNSNCPVLVKADYGIDVYDQDIPSIGVHKRMKPLVHEMPLSVGMILLSYSDGIQAAGRKRGKTFDIGYILRLLADCGAQDVDFIAQNILEYALDLDDYRPGDDMTVAVLGLSDEESGHLIRRMNIVYPY
ncbi:MAG: PP2C family protein-serine/threonine phosphatase [Sporomusaceae bacterium]|nr:PP2C family protein-serine/threonine phosphatase [Sporomusaceae bacterium]